MKRTVRRITNLSLVTLITSSIVLAAIAPLFTPPTSQAQTNPQTTDIFTGQFIPAYYGAAYDPSEAYKQMAGLPVYVFAYDTWGKVVNNFAYETQVKADGSFQAAGLPNASHYGVCVPSRDTSFSTVFRAPKPDDGLQNAFAYSQAVFPNNSETINTQMGKPATMARLNNDEGCRVFLTSSRQADIANHINIFPLVPTSVLSVIIKDNVTGTTDYFSFDKPYEVYAQRVVVSNLDSNKADRVSQNLSQASTDLNQCRELAQSQPNPGEAIAQCQTAYNNKVAEYNNELSSFNSIAAGPVIRGRTTSYSTELGGGTIFQAFAPRGIYMVTYWRPDTRSPNAKMTYLTYDGVSPLGSPFNGIAVEEAKYPSAYPDSNSWKSLSTRSIKEGGEAWVANAGTLNLWGLITSGQNGKTIPRAKVGLQVSENKVGFIDIGSKSCANGKDQTQWESSLTGVYILSSACSSKHLPGAIDGSITATIGALGNTKDTREQTGVSVQINGKEGPSRRDLSMTGIPPSLSGILKRDGQPFAYAWVDLYINGKKHAKVAQADSTGFFYIPNSHFNDNPYTQYKIVANPPYTAPNFSSSYENSYALNIDQVMAARNGMRGDMGVLAINTKPKGTVQSMLANLSLSNVLAKLRIPTAFAQNKSTDENKTPVSDSQPWKFEIDQDSLGVARNYFNATNYTLKTVEINPAGEGISIVGGNDEYELFTRGGDYDGIWPEAYTGNSPSGSQDADWHNWAIRGVVLSQKQGTSHTIANIFRDLKTDSLRFNLRVRFEYNHDATTTGTMSVNEVPINTKEGQDETQNTSSGQVDGTTYPKVLEATWPIDITVDSNTDPKNFTVVYDPIALEIETPNCGGGSWLKSGVTDLMKNIACKLVLGGISGMKKAIDLMANNFLTVDPLGYFGSNIVIKYWNILRNFVNSMAVLILLVAGVAIMLRYEPQTFQLQSVLQKLIIAIVLVNFSILLIQIAVDIANVLALGGYHMLNSMTTPDASGLSNARSAAGSIAAVLITMLATAAASGFGGFIAFVIFLSAILILLIYVAYKIIFQWFFRLVALWICIILAPAAFAARVLPGTQSYFGKWKNMLVGTLVAQVALALMLSLSLAMIVGIKQATGATEGFMLTIAGFALLYMATKVPNKAAAMMGSDLAGGLEGMAKKGLSAGSLRMKQAAALRYQRRAAEDARNADPEYARKSLLGKQLFKRIDSAKRLREDFIISKDEKNKASEAGIAQALEERSRQLYRENKKAYDYQDERELKDKLAEQSIDLAQKSARIKVKDIDTIDERLRDQKLRDAANEATTQARIDEKRMDKANLDLWENQRAEDKDKKLAETDAEVIKQSTRLANRHIAEHELREVIRSARNAAKDAEREADMRIEHPESLDFRDIKAAQAKTYSLSDESVGQIFDGVKFTDARQGFVAVVASPYTIDNTFIDPSDPANNRTLGDLTFGAGRDDINSYSKGYEKVFAEARSRAASADLDLDRFDAAKTSMDSQIRTYGLATNQQEKDFINRFEYEGESDSAKAWRLWLKDTGVYSGTEVDRLEDSDVKGAVLRIVKQRAVSKSGVTGWTNTITQNETQATQAGIPDRARLTMAQFPELNVAAPSREIAGARRHITAPPAGDFVYGRYYDQAKRWVTIVNDAYAVTARTGSDLTNSTTPSLSNYNTAVEGLRNLGYQVADP